MAKILYYVGNYKGYVTIRAKNERGARQIASRMANSSFEFAFLKNAYIFPSLEAMNSYYNKPLPNDFD